MLEYSVVGPVFPQFMVHGPLLLMKLPSMPLPQGAMLLNPEAQAPDSAIVPLVTHSFVLQGTGRPELSIAKMVPLMPSTMSEIFRVMLTPKGTRAAVPSVCVP